MRLTGFCTPSGTKEYVSRYPSSMRHSFRLTPGSLQLSSIGIGTYLGDNAPETDESVTEAIYSLLLSGVNVIDTAPNYRNGAAERCIGHAINRVVSEKAIQRQEFFICTKVGIVPESLTSMHREQPLLGDAAQWSIYGDGYCFDTAYIDWQLNNSLSSLGVESLDCLFLHNLETLIHHLGIDAFMTQVAYLFVFLDELVISGRIKSYGIASWNAFRTLADSPYHIDLAGLFSCLSSAGINISNLRYLQLPLGAWGFEAFSVHSQRCLDGTPCSILRYALENNLSVFANSALLQGELLGYDLDDLPGEVGHSKAQRAINLARSIPGVTSLLVGMKSQTSVLEATSLMNSPYCNLDGGNQ